MPCQLLGSNRAAKLLPLTVRVNEISRIIPYRTGFVPARYQYGKNEFLENAGMPVRRYPVSRVERPLLYSATQPHLQRECPVAAPCSPAPLLPPARTEVPQTSQK